MLLLLFFIIISIFILDAGVAEALKVVYANVHWMVVIVWAKYVALKIINLIVLCVYMILNLLKFSIANFYVFIIINLNFLKFIFYFTFRFLVNFMSKVYKFSAVYVLHGLTVINQILFNYRYIYIFLLIYELVIKTIIFYFNSIIFIVKQFFLPRINIVINFLFLWASLIIFNLMIVFFLSFFFFVPFFFLRLICFILFSWFFFMWVNRSFVISYKTSILYVWFKSERKRILYPLKVVIKFFSKLYFKVNFLLIAILSKWNIKDFFYIFFLYRHVVFNFSFWYNFSSFSYIYGVFLAYFLSIPLWKKVAFYIFNYRRLLAYCHWLGKKIIGFTRKQVLFRWIGMFFGHILYLRNAKLEKRRLFRQCHRFNIYDFVEIALGYYFMRYTWRMAHSLYYCFCWGNYLLKKVKIFRNIYCNYVLLKFSFIQLRYKRFLLLISLWNYSILRFFIKYSIKFHFYNKNYIFKFKHNTISVK